MSLFLCLVLAVGDGDTLKAQCEQRVKPVTVRLQGIDAPEMAHGGFVKMGTQPFGPESKANLTTLCLGKKATVSATSIDRYGRTVGTVTCEGVNANEAQAKAGMAWALTPKKGSAIPALVEEAKAAKRGLWSGAPINPALWRKQASCSI